ncbi:hypothetical protein D8T47_16835 [Vibrio vulnificus]|nr:hypothetical protein D8T47_16835 [Vibrio vulnificus]
MPQRNAYPNFISEFKAIDDCFFNTLSPNLYAINFDGINKKKYIKLSVHLMTVILGSSPHGA